MSQPVEVTCGECGEVFYLSMSEYKQRSERTMRDELYCGRVCQVKARVRHGKRSVRL